VAGVAVDDKIPLPTRERMSPEAVTENFFIFFISDRKFFVSQLFNYVRRMRNGVKLCRDAFGKSGFPSHSTYFACTGHSEGFNTWAEQVRAGKKSLGSQGK
jgi:hypothetical protein